MGQWRHVGGSGPRLRWSRARPRPQLYSRALGALRTHDEAELVDATLGEAVGLRVGADRAELVGGGGIGALGQALPGPGQAPARCGRARPILSAALRHPGRARHQSASGHLSRSASADAADAPPTPRAHWLPKTWGRLPRELPPGAQWVPRGPGPAPLPGWRQLDRREGAGQP